MTYADLIEMVRCDLGGYFLPGADDDRLHEVSTETLEAIREHSHRRYLVGLDDGRDVELEVRALEYHAVTITGPGGRGLLRIDPIFFLYAGGAALHVQKWMRGGVDDLLPSGQWQTTLNGRTPKEP